MQVLACENGEFLTQYIKNHNNGLNIKNHICSGDVVQVEISTLTQYQALQTRVLNLETFVGLDPNAAVIEPRPFIDYGVFTIGFSATLTFWALGKGIGIILKQIK